jgi:hypothetical protein
MTQVLRYPYEAITDTTDYLQITISAYKPAGTDLIRTTSLTVPDVSVKGTNSGNLYTESIRTEGGVILLPMPSNIQDGNSVSYADDSIDAITAKLFSGSSNVMTTPYPDKPTGSQTPVTDYIGKVAGRLGQSANYILSTDGLKDIAMKSLAAQATSVFGGNVTLNQVLARENGTFLNPNMELLFNGVTLRTFRFSFKMTPRDDKESEQIRLIIRSLKRNMAAKSGTTFLGSPNIFGLRYRKGNDNHPFLHKFKPCALTDIAVNYTGENVYATYADGTPISMTMDLTFKELVPIYDTDYGDRSVTDANGNVTNPGTDSDTTVGY